MLCPHRERWLLLRFCWLSSVSLLTSEIFISTQRKLITEHEFFNLGKLIHPLKKFLVTGLSCEFTSPPPMESWETTLDGLGKILFF